MRSHRRPTPTLTLLVVTGVLVACEAAPAATDRSPAPAATRAEVRVAFVKDLSIPDADEHALPASRGVELAFETARITGSVDVEVTLEQVDLSQGSEELAELAGDPALVASILAPGVDPMGLELPADLPVLSLSGLGEGDRPAFVRLVPPLETLVEVLAGRLRRWRPCVLSEDPPPDPFGAALADRLRRAHPALVDPAEAPSAVAEHRCDLVVWAGGPDAAAVAATSLAEAGVPLVGGDRLLDPDFLAASGPLAEGAIAVCPCADVSTSTELSARRFIQDYQSEHGSAPGAYAVEGWDAGRIVVAALVGSEPTRDGVAAWVAALEGAEGLVHAYRFDPAGELSGGRSRILVYRVEGGRWRPLGVEGGRCLGLADPCGGAG